MGRKRIDPEKKKVIFSVTIDRNVMKNVDRFAHQNNTNRSRLVEKTLGYLYGDSDESELDNSIICNEKAE